MKVDILYFIMLFCMKLTLGFGKIIDGVIYVSSMTLIRTDISMYVAKKIGKMRYSKLLRES